MSVPQNRDAEQAVLGAVLQYPDDRRVLEVVLVLTEDDFADPAHRIIWRAVKGIVSQGGQIEYSIVLGALGKEKDKIGGAAYLAMLPDRAPVPSVLPGVVEELLRKSRERRLWFGFRKALAMLQDGADAAKVMDYVLRVLEESRRQRNKTDLHAVDATPNLGPGIPLGLWQVDGIIGGLKAGELMVVAGRTSVGKTMFGLRAALEMAIGGMRVMYVSLEMPAADLKVRAQAYLADVPLKRFRLNTLSGDDRVKVSEAEQRYGDALKHVTVYVEPAVTPGQLMWLVRMAKLAGEADVVIIDHGGRMRADGNVRSEYEAASRIAHGVKNVALKQEVPVIMLWQLSRGVEHRQDKKPTLADLRDSGQIEETADIVLLLSRQGYYDKSLAPDQDTVELQVAKNRAGETAVVTVPWLDFLRRPPERAENQQMFDDEEFDRVWQDSSRLP